MNNPTKVTEEKKETLGNSLQTGVIEFLVETQSVFGQDKWEAIFLYKIS